MNYKIFHVVMLAIVLVSCNHHHETEIHEGHEAVKIQFTAYSNEFELFAEADPFVAGQPSNILSHFSHLPSFKALEKGGMTIRMTVNGKKTTQTLNKPTRKGIFSFNLIPETSGKGRIVFDILTDTGTFQVIVPDITVFGGEEEARHAEESAVLSKTNTTVFTKEQSWKIDFATGLPSKEPFGQVIKTTAQILPAPGEEMILTAKTNGIVLLTTNYVLEGDSVSKGQLLFSISGNGLAEDDASVRFTETKNNFEKAASDYERMKELSKEKIVSGKELLEAKNKYDNSKAIFDNLNENFSLKGQNVTSPMAGIVKQLFVQSGTYVEAGQPLLTITQNKTLVLHAEVSQNYIPILGSIHSANIRTLPNNQIYTLEQLHGKVLSYGKITNSDNYLIPVNLQIDNLGGFVAGGFVEIYLKTLTQSQALTVLTTTLLEDQGNFFVFVQVTPELFEKREVKIGATDGVKTEILNGISAYERIVTKGAILVKLAQATGSLDAHSGHVH
ncbi:MAG: efflux RND transporter periplasmic adaptor subunit [Salinivirgaceae bacterium]|nr:efflux RND transporter periplasmic adaptor subunit [Salinivirgaceae bacterium]